MTMLMPMDAAANASSREARSLRPVDDSLNHQATARKTMQKTVVVPR